jgi:5'-nucleotidase / UDP-sugar diphosphatase
VFAPARTALTLLVLLAGCSVAGKDRPPPEKNDPPPGLIDAAKQPPPASSSAAIAPPPVVKNGATIGTCDAAERAKGTVRFTLAHLNDLQARYSDQIAGKSRYAYIAGYLRSLKAQNASTLVLDAGDDYEKGALAELRSMGETTRQMVQALPIDVRTIGNHDFAYGEAAVLKDVRESQHPVLAANIRHKTLAEQPFKPYARLDVGCAKVGIIGLVTQGFGADDQPTKEPYNGVFVQDDHYVEVAKREISAHRGEVDVLIALTHLGFGTDLMLASRAKGLDLVVGAHTEDLVKEPLVVPHGKGQRTTVVQAGHYGETLGRGEVVVDLKEHIVKLEKYKIVEIDASVPIANDVAELASTLERSAVPDAHNPIGRTQRAVKRGKEMSELLFKAAQKQLGADIVIVGRDLFWDGLPKGDVTLQRLYDTVLVQRQPSGTSGFSSLWTVELTGEEAVKLFERYRPMAAYETFKPAKLDPTKESYKLVLDKRAFTYPRANFGPSAKLPNGTFSGEMVDVLEGYIRARTAAGTTID